MNPRTKLALVDPEMHRRAALSFALRNDGFSVEPHESTRELADALPREGILLVRDESPLLEECLALAARSCPGVLCLAWRENPQPAAIVRALRLGAASYVAAPFGGKELLRAIDEGLDAQAAARPGEAAGARLGAPLGLRDPLAMLTPRERQVLEAAAAGMPSRVIGEHLAISRRTVDAHRLNLLHKMGVSSMSDALRIARGARRA